jgi:hypothetical protein
MREIIEYAGKGLGSRAFNVRKQNDKMLTAVEAGCLLAKAFGVSAAKFRRALAGHAFNTQKRNDEMLTSYRQSIFSS